GNAAASAASTACCTMCAMAALLGLVGSLGMSPWSVLPQTHPISDAPRVARSTVHLSSPLGLCLANGPRPSAQVFLVPSHYQPTASAPRICCAVRHGRLAPDCAMSLRDLLSGCCLE